MSTEPYTPDEADLIVAVALNFPEDEARRGIAKLKADALRSASAAVMEIDGRRDDDAAKWLRERANRIEEEA